MNNSIDAFAVGLFFLLETRIGYNRNFSYADVLFIIGNHTRGHILTGNVIQALTLLETRNDIERNEMNYKLRQREKKDDKLEH